MRCDAHLAIFSIFGAFAWLGESNFVRGTLISSECEKENGSEDTWICSGDELHSIPGDLKVESNEMKLHINNAPMLEVLRNESLTPYADNLTELHLNSLSYLHTIEPGVFNKTKKLKRIYICEARSLHHIDDEVFQVQLPNLISLRIISSGLLTVPYLGVISSEASSMDIIDFDRNKIVNISEGRLVNLRVAQLILTNNEIQSIDRMAFNQSRISKLDLSGNMKLTNIDKEAFLNVTFITEINLSQTSIKELPTEGLNETKRLFIENTKTLTKFPPLKYLWNITQAHLTYPYHCCALIHRDIHDPESYKIIQEKDKKVAVKSKDWCMKERNETWCEEWVKNQSRLVTKCTCYPKPGVFSPCEDIMGNYWLRIMIWIVGVLAIIGNLAVIIVLILKSSTTVPEFLMCNLAFADLCMGIYLLMIASVDARSIGIYFNEAIDWQSGLGCKIAGVFTIFSTELSVFTLVAMSCERWYTIANAMYGRRLRFKSALGIMLVGWIYAGSMAALPLFGISSYDKTSLCLPLEQQTSSDTFYLSTMLVFTCTSFLVIVFCYGSMYFSVNRSSEYKLTSLARLDRKIARKMALLISLSFACWAPIAFFGITALAGLPLIDLTQTKYVLVIFYPLNSVVNPIVYVLLTRQYREAAWVLLARFIGESRVKRLMGKRNSSEKRSTCRTDKTPALPDSPLTMSNNINDSNSLSAKYAGVSPEKKVFTKEIDDAAKEKVTASFPVATSPI